MPGKGRKVAARQAQVSRRRRRQTREGVASNPVVISDAVAAGNNEEGASVAIDPEIHASNDPGRVRNPINNRGFRSVGTRDGQLLSNGMVKSECLRISIMAGALTSVLVILAIII